MLLPAGPCALVDLVCLTCSGSFQLTLFTIPSHLIDAFVVFLDLSIYAVEEYAGPCTAIAHVRGTSASPQPHC